MGRASRHTSRRGGRWGVRRRGGCRWSQWARGCAPYGGLWGWRMWWRLWWSGERAGEWVGGDVVRGRAGLTNNRDYETRAQETLEVFAGVVEHFGLFAAS